MIAATIDDNYERIKGDLESRGLSYDRLIDDVLDHVCCMVEEFMNQGFDFESSYVRVLDSIGESRLTEIQHQTLLNLDKKFQLMKNFTYVFGLTSAALTIVGSFFKSMHWAGAGILLTVGILSIVLVFLPLYFITGYREQAERKNPVYAIVGFITLALLLSGALFKIMHWPGAGVVILAGTGFLVIGFVPLYVVNAFQRGGKGRVNLPYIVMLLVGVALVMVFSNIKMSKILLDVYVDESLTNEARIESVDNRTAHLMDLVQDSAYADKMQAVVKIHDQARELQVMITGMQEGMVAYVDQPGASISEVNAKDNRWAARDAMMEHGNFDDFKLESEKFKEMLSELIKDPVAWSQIEDHMEFTGRIWRLEYFGPKQVINDPLVKNYFKLSDASLGIALSEYVAISYLMHH